MEVINKLLTEILGIISKLLPIFKLPEEFIAQLDKALVLVITLIEGASWILPMDVMIICFTTMLVVDNWAITVTTDIIENQEDETIESEIEPLRPQTIYESFMDYDFIKIIDFVKWCVKDIIPGKDQLRLFGIWGFTGYYGQEKP